MILQMCSFGIQNAWVLPVWVLLRRLRLRKEKCVVALLLLAATPFMFFNTVYVWPKLLAATFCLVQHILLSDEIRERDRLSRRLFPIALSGFAAGLAVMAHGSAAIAVLAIYIAAVYRQWRARWLHVAISGAIALVVVLPWSVWCKVAAPTTNPLPRFLLTGDFGLSKPTPSGVLESTLHMYQGMPFATWLGAKLAAAKTLLGLDLSFPRMAFGTFGDLFRGFESIRAYQFFFLVPSLGLLLIPLFWLVRIRRCKQASALPRRLIVRDLALAATLTLLFQFVVMMAPHALHHYPYFLPFGLHLLAVIAIMTRETKILRVLGCASYLLFVLVWIILILARTPVLSIGGLVCALILLASATLVVGKWALRQQPGVALR
jgi:4-amino-4-deoxy-L-arabinose transferase-like glycosyltransferase